MWPECRAECRAVGEAEDTGADELTLSGPCDVTPGTAPREVWPCPADDSRRMPLAKRITMAEAARSPTEIHAGAREADPRRRGGRPPPPPRPPPPRPLPPYPPGQGSATRTPPVGAMPLDGDTGVGEAADTGEDSAAGEDSDAGEDNATGEDSSAVVGPFGL